MEVRFFLKYKKFSIEWLSQKTFDKTKILKWYMLENIMDCQLSTFHWILITSVSARSILVNFSPNKNLTSNGSKPIRVLTSTKSSHSDDRLPNAYSLSEFQAHRSNFVIHFFFHSQPERRSTLKKTVPTGLLD